MNNKLEELRENVTKATVNWGRLYSARNEAVETAAISVFAELRANSELCDAKKELEDYCKDDKLEKLTQNNSKARAGFVKSLEDAKKAVTSAGAMDSIDYILDFKEAYVYAQDELNAYIEDIGS